MYTITSSTMTGDYKQEEVPALEWKFNITNGNEGELTISDVLLDTEALATERALSEFLKNSYKTNEIRFTTHLTTFTLNMLINVYGILYIVKSIGTVINELSIKTQVRAIRYE